ncbi:MAG: CRISPR-associated endonuclease Cas1 [Verrucomicrobiota bacterium]
MNPKEDTKSDPSSSNRSGSPIQQGQADDLTLFNRAEGTDQTRQAALPNSEGSENLSPLAQLVSERLREIGGDEAFTDPIPSRMLNEFVYCQRLYYYEFVEGVFLHNADTRKGKAVHSRVDRQKSGALPSEKRKNQKKPKDAETEPDSPPEMIHSRSVSLGSDALGVTAKLDLVEVRQREDDLFSEITVCPVEYKVGSPREDDDGSPTLWDSDKIQLGLQILLLRENNYECDEGIIFYRGSRQRVRLAMTGEIENWIVDTIAQARRVAGSTEIPLPLIDSPKCVRCSLAPVCLPDETQMLGIDRGDSAAEDPDATTKNEADPPRRLIAARDEKRVVYLNTPGLQVGVTGETLRITQKKELVEEIPIHNVLHLGLFGNIGLTTPGIRQLCRLEIPISYFSGGGWFYGQTHGLGLKNVTTRIAQFEAARNELVCLEFAKAFISGKIRNQRTLYRRNHSEPDSAALKRFKRAATRDVERAASASELLGIEGAAAHLYFSQFSGLIKAGADDPDDPTDSETSDEAGANEASEPAPIFDFDFQKRNRRPPRDPVNALLSFSYSMLVKDCTVAAAAVGLDPYVGFFHRPRHGRPALALDIMEEFRPLIADSAVLNAINNRVVTAKHFVKAGDAVNLTPEGRKHFLQVWERRMRDTVTHPVFQYKVSYRRAIELQCRILARVLTGEIPDYIPFTTR